MKPINIPEVDLVRLYFDERKTTTDIAKIYHCSMATVLTYLAKYGLSPRTKSEAQRIRNNDLSKRNQGSPGTQNPNYRHGIYVQERIYRKMLQKEFCVKCGSRENLVIHHKNDDHYDNHPDNLEVLCGSCHSRLHKTEYWKKHRI